jgi:hypothetical protein
MAELVTKQAAGDCQMVGSHKVVAMKAEPTLSSSMAATSVFALIVLVICASLGL